MFTHLRCIHFSTSACLPLSFLLVLITWVSSNLKTQLNVIHYSFVLYRTQKWDTQTHTHTHALFSQGMAHDNKGIKVSLHTMWRCSTLRPKTPTALHSTHTHISSSSLTGTDLSFLLLGNNNKADAIYQLLAENHDLLFMVTLNWSACFVYAEQGNSSSPHTHWHDSWLEEEVCGQKRLREAQLIHHHMTRSQLYPRSKEGQVF